MMPVNNLVLPEGYPSQHRYQDSDFFRAALFGVSKAAFYVYMGDGRVPPPDAKFGNRNRWRETTIAAAVEAFALNSKPKG